ncbi:MAG: transposase [Bifidobacteriaceae bacterium]|jgi:hypothetical protein|nr:transposase [Bifidobacteriaceae bacterium]
MRTQYSTGLSESEFWELTARIKDITIEHGQNPGPNMIGRPQTLDLASKVRLTLTLLRTNITQQLAAEMLAVSQPTVSVVKSQIEPLIDQALTMTGIPLGEAASARPLIVDGTYIPTGNRKATGSVNYSGKRHCQNLSIQVACDLGGTLVATSAPVPGARHDSAALTLTGWDQILADADWFADSAYTAHGAITPIRKRPGGELTESEREFNRQVSSIRCTVERTISHLKNWRVLSKGYRRQLKKLPFVIALVTKLELYRLGW